MTPVAGDGAPLRMRPGHGGLLVLCAVLACVAPSALGGPPSATAQADAMAPVRHAVQAGDPATALRRLDRLPPGTRAMDHVRYLRARLLARLDRFDDALRVVDSLDAEALPQGVQEDLQRRRARWQARAGRCEEAAPTLRRLSKGAPAGQGPVLTALSAQCLLAAGALDEAEQRLRGVVRADARGVDTFATWLALAEVQWRQGDTDAAAEELRALLVTRPEHPDAPAALHQLEALTGPVRFTVDERMDRAARFIEVRQSRPALRELDEAGEPQDRAARRRWLHLRGTALYRTRHDYADAARALDQAARLGGPTAIEDAFHAARALSRAGRTAQAIRAYRRLVRQHPRHRLAAKAEYLAALVELGHDAARGAAAMRRFLGGPRASRIAANARSARWHLAMRDFRRGHFPDAATGFRRYARSGRGPLVEARGHYWRGRALEAAGRDAGAVAAYEDALGVQVRHWYAVLAEDRLARMDRAPDRTPPPEASGDPSVPELPAAVPFYLRLGLTSDARAALTASEEALREAAGLRGLVAAHGHIGHWSRAFRLAATRQREALRRWPEEATGWVWRAAYPRPFHDAVAAQAAVHGVPEALLYAVMRQESAYDPEAESYAGAVGLMQLMPRTARGLSAEADPVRLFDPQFNVGLGAQLLSQLLREFDGSLPLAVAAYNAGSHRVRRWRRARPGTDLDLFVERIPIDQTRNYVRRVLSHYAAYRLLEGDLRASLDELP